MCDILFLGTGAADWDIADKGKYFRRNSAALVNGDLMVGCGEHIFDFAKNVKNKQLYNNITDIIITHNHCDHFSKESVLKLAQTQKIRVGCTKEIKDIIGENANIEFVIFSPFEEMNMGKYKIIPLLANHSIIIDGDAYAFHYIIKTPDGKAIFYGLDGAWFLRPSWEVMEKYKFDIMVLDCTVGDRADWRIFEHNTIPMLRLMVEQIRNENMVSKQDAIIASHLAKTLHLSHEETEKILNKENIITAYDGMKIEF